jgi:hypothetical protein
MAATVTGKNANVYIGDSSAVPSKGQDIWGISDFSVTFDRGTVEQELIGQPGNYFDQGALSIEGSLTNCRFAASGNAEALLNIVDGSGDNEFFRVSGSIGSTNGLTFYFKSCQVTSYEVTMGDASTITEASIDFQVINPYSCTYSAGHVEA